MYEVEMSKYLQGVKNKSTAKSYKQHLKKGLKFFEEKNITNPSEADFQNFKDSLDMKDKAKNDCVSCNQRFFEWLEKQPPTDKITSDELPSEDKPVRINFVIKGSLHKDFSVYAWLENKTITEILTSYIEEVISKNSSKIEMVKHIRSNE